MATTTKRKGKGGRPRKLNRKKRAALLEEIRAGRNLHAACVTVGVHYATLRRLIIRGERTKRGELREFCDAVNAAQEEVIAKAEAAWVKEFPNDWRAARDYLRSRRGDLYAPVIRHLPRGIRPNEQEPAQPAPAISTVIVIESGVPRAHRPAERPATLSERSAALRALDPPVEETTEAVDESAPAPPIEPKEAASA